jgi:hypothetical protein
MNRRTWNPAALPALPLDVVEPTDWDVVGLFDSTDDTEIAKRLAAIVISAEWNGHRFRALTDKLDRASEWLRWVESRAGMIGSLMVGTTCRTQADADRLLPVLAELPARFRYVRVEPSEMVDLSRWLMPVCRVCGERATCVGAYEGDSVDEAHCDTHCGHGNEDGYCDDAASVLDLVEIAGGPGPEQLRLVQAIGAQVLARQTRDTPQARNPDAGSEWEYVETGPEQLVAGPALAIVANDPDSTVHGSHPYVALAGQRRRWNQPPVGWLP